MTPPSKLVLLFHWSPAFLFALLIFLVSHQSNPPGRDLAPDYVVHFFQYGFFSLTICWGITTGLTKSLDLRRGTAAWVMAVAYGCLDELHQMFVPGRDASTLDIVADTAGAVIFVAAAVLFLEILFKGKRFSDLL